MRILFLSPPFGSHRPEGLDAPLGIMYLAAVLKKAGHQCSFVDHAWEKQDDWSRWDSAILEKPDLVLVNTQVRFDAETKEALRRVKAKYSALLAVAFGPQASTQTLDLLKAGFDACVIGEPEEVVQKFLQGNKSLAGLATKENPQPGLAPRIKVESLPVPDWEFVNCRRYIEAAHNAVYTASRGLNYEDKFNQPPLIFAQSPTSRLPVERVIRELRVLRQSYPGSYMLLFHDEVFTEDRDWVIDLCHELKKAKLGVPYWCFTRPDLVDPELCQIMRQSGFVGVSMGMESGSDRILKMLGRKSTVLQIKNGFKSVQKAGLLTTGSVMIGTAGVEAGESDETIGEIKSTVDLVKHLHPDVLTVTLTTPLPGTPFYDNLKERILAKLPKEFNYLHVWPGKYPLKLKNLSADDLTSFAKEIRCVWKKGLWLTAWRIVRLAISNRDFRSTLFNQIIKVIRRKVLPGKGN